MDSPLNQNRQSTYFIDENDERELARLQLQDRLFNELFDMFPPGFPSRKDASVLDVACGPGGWPLDVAQTHPEMRVVGVDISPQMITYARAQADARELPVQFRIMNALKEWHFPDAYFDLVNMRFIGGFTPVKVLESLLQECRRVLRPGGVVRNIEHTYLAAPTCASVQELQLLTNKAIYQAGLSFSPHEYSWITVIARELKTMGFKQVVAVPYLADLSFGEPFHLPMLENLLVSGKLLQPFLVKTGVVQLEVIRKLWEQLVEEWNLPRFCGHWYFCSVSGIKE